MTRPGRLRLATAAVLSASVLAACSGGGGGSAERPPVVKYQPPGEQPDVAAPTKDDTVLGPDATPAPVSSPEKPNLLMITMDDAALKDMQFMPHLKEVVADQGVTIANGLAPTPICVPARASLLTGQYANNHGAVTVAGEGGSYTAFDDENTLPGSLQKAGYDTMMVGKYLNGYTKHEVHHEPPGWTVWRPTVDFATYNFEHPQLLVDGEIKDYDTYSTTLLSDQSNALIEDHADGPDGARPWYLWVNYVAPHHGSPEEDDDPEGISTTVPAKQDRDSFKDLDLDTTPEMFEKDPSDKALVRSARQKSPKERRAALREVRQQRVESLQAVDRAIARTVETLEETGQLDDTYVVVTSDNGYAVGEHHLNGKLWHYRDTIGIPMYIRGPGLPAGTTTQAPVTNADWAPTFAALADTTLDRDADGVDVMPWLDSDATRRVVPIAGWPVKGGLDPLYTGVIVGPWTYVRGRKGRGELYYAKNDPYQLSNLFRDPRYKAMRQQLHDLWLETKDCAGATCPRTFMK